MDKYQEALDLICDKNYELDVFLEKYPQIQTSWQTSKGFSRYVEKLKDFESKYGNMPAEVIQELVDKETPMKPNYDKFYDTNDGFFNKYYCPKCRHEKVFVNRFENKYCHNCGQKLDWGTSNEKED